MSKKLPKSADTGRIVKKSELKKNPKTTYAQTVKGGKKKGK